MDNITFEKLPEAVSLLIERVGELTDMMKKMSEKNLPKQTEQPKLLNLNEVAAMLGKAVSTIYAMTSENRIPHYKRGNKLYFFEDEILRWIEDGGKDRAGTDTDFEKRLEELRNGKKHKPGAWQDNLKGQRP